MHLPPLDINYVLLVLYVANFVYARYALRQWEGAYYGSRNASLFSRSHFAFPFFKAYPMRTWHGSVALPSDDLKCILYIVCVFPPSIFLLVLSVGVFLLRVAVGLVRQSARRLHLVPARG